MNPTARFRQALIVLIALAGFAALLWGASMLVGGFRAAGLLENPWNPVDSALVWFAAFAVMGVNFLFYQVIVARTRRRFFATVGMILCLVVLTGISTTLQTYVTLRSTQGENLMNAQTVSVQAQGAEASRIDQDITAEFEARIGVIERRMRYEEIENGGKGPKYLAAKREFDRLSERYTGTLGRTRRFVLQGGNISADAAAVRSYLGYLREKARVYAQFAKAVGVLATDYPARIAMVEAGLSDIKAGKFVDERSIVYQTAIAKLREMFASGGQASPEFTMSFLVGIGPDICALFCALLLSSLRTKDDDDDPQWPSSGQAWDPSDKVWGKTPREGEA